MTTTRRSAPKITSAIAVRWVPRLASLPAALVFYFAFVFMSYGFKGEEGETLGISAWALLLLGPIALGIAWWRPLLGGSIALLCCLVALPFENYAVGFCPYVGIPGALFVLSTVLERRMRSSEVTGDSRESS